MSARLLICEGPGDIAFFQKLLHVRALPALNVRCPSGTDSIGHGKSAFGNLLSALRLEAALGDVSGVLLIRDSDDDPQEGFRDLEKQLEKAGVSIPSAPLETTTDDHFGIVKVIMVPWHDRRGQLETLCLESIRGLHRAKMDCVKTAIECMGSSTWAQGPREKAELRMFFAGFFEEDPNTGLQYVWKRQVQAIDLNGSSFDQIAEAIRSFCDET